jgi:hypothetical protein
MDPPRLPSADDPSLDLLDDFLTQVFAKKPEERLADAGEFYDAMQMLRTNFTAPEKRLGPFVSDLFGKEISALIKSVSDPEAQKALRAGTGMNALLTPVSVSGSGTPPTLSSRKRPSDPSGRALSDSEIARTRLRTPASMLVPKPAVRSAPRAPAIEAEPEAPLEIEEDTAPPAPRDRRFPTAVAAIAATVVVAGGAIAFFALRGSGTPAEISEATPMVEQPQPTRAAVVAEAPKPFAPSTETDPTKSQIPQARPGETQHPTTKPALKPTKVATVKAPRPAGGGLGPRELAVRFRRIKSAWDAQKTGASPDDVRLFDLTLGSIQKLIAGGKPDELAEAKSSLDGFVKSALRGVEP